MQSVSKKLPYIFVAITLVFLLGIGFFLWLKTSSHPPEIRQLRQTQTPSITTTDLAPHTPTGQKTAVLVMHEDSSYEKFIVGNSILSGFIKSLPPGDKIISQTAE